MSRRIRFKSAVWAAFGTVVLTTLIGSSAIGRICRGEDRPRPARHSNATSPEYFSTSIHFAEGEFAVELPADGELHEDAEPDGLRDDESGDRLGRDVPVRVRDEDHSADESAGPESRRDRRHRHQESRRARIQAQRQRLADWRSTRDGKSGSKMTPAAAVEEHDLVEVDEDVLADVPAPAPASTSAPSLFSNGSWFAWPAVPADGVSEDDVQWHFGAKGRVFYSNDQRWEFTGAESTYGVNAVVDGGLSQEVGDWTVFTEGELFLNSPYDQNLLANTTFVRSFNGNFHVDTLQISQLRIGAKKGDWTIQAGRFVTPFGRFYYPIYTNNFWDSPFIRAEAVPYRETGLLAEWNPDPLIATLGITNGSFNQDTNSSKAVVGRIGQQFERVAYGASVRWQDGIGSEEQKVYNNQAGIDAMYWITERWQISTEVTYDQYGQHKGGQNPDLITWGRSLYFRDANQGGGRLHGKGYYVNLLYRGDAWTFNMNYGDYFPQKYGDPRQDMPIHRGLLKASRQLSRHLEVYSVGLFENSIALVPGHFREGIALLFGAQWTL